MARTRTRRPRNNPRVGIEARQRACHAFPERPASARAGPDRDRRADAPGPTTRGRGASGRVVGAPWCLPRPRRAPACASIVVAPDLPFRARNSHLDDGDVVFAQPRFPSADGAAMNHNIVRLGARPAHVSTLLLCPMVLAMVLSPLLGCAVETPGAQPTSSEVSNAGEQAPSEASPLSDADCNAQYDAMLAYTQKCGDASFFSQPVREPGRAGFVELCKMRGTRAGTGYTAAFYAQCTDYLRGATCGDATGLVKACSTPKGTLPHGAACNTDDQCAPGACILANLGRDGSGCGTCGAPARRELGETCDLGPADRCLPGMVCRADFQEQKPNCKPVVFTKLGKAGDSCRGYGEDCGSGLVCNNSVCKATLPDGAACDYNSPCRPGSWCQDKACKPKGRAGESSRNDRFGCDAWTRSDGAGTCRVEPALQCR